MPHWIRPNPHQSTYANMLLFLREQVEKFAWNKWGSPEAMDLEFEKREKEKTSRKEKKYKEKIKQLRKGTRTSTWQKTDLQIKSTCDHIFTLLDDQSLKVCQCCGMSVQVEQL